MGRVDDDSQYHGTIQDLFETNMVGDCWCGDIFVGRCRCVIIDSYVANITVCRMCYANRSIIK